MKKILAMALSLVLVLGLTLSGTIAYLTDTDSTVNVMTVGNVDIEQLENGKEEGGFAQGAPLYPAYYESAEIDWDTAVGILDKEVTVKNTGTSEAYVRTWFAFEAGDMDAKAFEDYILLKKNEGDASKWDWEWDLSKTYEIKDEKGETAKYYLAIATLKEALPVGETTEASLIDVAMSKYATNAQTEPLGSEYTVLVLSQAMQTINFEDKSPAEALDIGFESRKMVNGEYDSTDFAKHPWLNGVDMPEGFNVPGTTIRMVKADTPQQGGIIYLHSADDFRYLNTLIKDWDEITGGEGHYHYQWDWDVVLNCDVDLEKKNWTPVEIGILGGFDGNGHTISNLKIESTANRVGLFSGTYNNDNGKCPISNLVIDGANVTGGDVVGVVVGWGTTPISNVTVKNAIVNGNKYVGGIVGKAQASLTNCSVINSAVTGTDKEVGGVVGFLDIGETNRTDAYVTNCSAENTKVSGTEEVGGIIGRAFARGDADGSTITVSGCTVSDVTVTATDANSTYYGDILGRDYDETGVIMENNGKAVTVKNSAELTAAVAAGATSLILEGGDYDIAGCGGKTLTISGSEDAVLKLYNEGEDGCDYGFDDSTVTFNGVTIDTTANNGNYKGYARLNATYNNCKFVGAYTTHNVQTFNNCSFDFKNGYLWIWGATEVNFNGCTFGGNSKTILAHGWASSVVNIKDCSFAATEKGYTGSGDHTAAVEIDPAGTNTYTINFSGTNTVNENYNGWTRIKDNSTGHTITGLPA